MVDLVVTPIASSFECPVRSRHFAGPHVNIIVNPAHNTMWILLIISLPLPNISLRPIPIPHSPFLSFPKVFKARVLSICQNVMHQRLFLPPCACGTANNPLKEARISLTVSSRISSTLDSLYWIFWDFDKKLQKLWEHVQKIGRCHWQWFESRILILPIVWALTRPDSADLTLYRFCHGDHIDRTDQYWEHFKAS